MPPRRTSEDDRLRADPPRHPDLVAELTRRGLSWGDRNGHLLYGDRLPYAYSPARKRYGTWSSHEARPTQRQEFEGASARIYFTQITGK